MTRFGLLFVILLGGCVAHPTRQPLAVSPRTPRISVLTYNVNFGIAGDPQTLRAIAQDDADVVFLQETNDQWESAIRAELSRAYPHMQFKQCPPAGGAGGLAVLSKLPIVSLDYLPAKSWFPAARIALDSGIGKLQVLNVHLRPPLSNGGSLVSGYFTTPPVRQVEIESFAAALDSNLPTLIVGDFNENERGRAVAWLRRHGMRSALPEFAPYAQTWRWHTSVGTLRGRYDHLCYNDRLWPLRVEVRNTGRSDHLPVFGVFTLAGNPTTQRSVQ